MYHDTDHELRTLKLPYVLDSQKPIHYGQKVGLTLLKIKNENCQLGVTSTVQNYFAAYITIDEDCVESILSQADKLGAEYIILEDRRGKREGLQLSNSGRRIPVFIINDR